MATNQEIAGIIIEFLQGSLKRGEIPDDNKDSIEFAIESIADGYGIDKDDAETLAKGRKLEQLIAVAEQSGSKPAESKAAPASEPAAPKVEVSPETKKKADELKQKGNGLMARRDFSGAIEQYSEAIKLDPTNAVYLANRAAAYSSLRKHEEAQKDAEQAIKVNPKYAKAYSRLGLAKYALGDAKGAMEAYEKGLEVEGPSHSAAMQKGYDTAKKRYGDELATKLGSESSSGADSSASSGAGATGAAAAAAGAAAGAAGAGLGGLGGLGGLAGLMNNPQVMQAAQQMMQNPDAMRNLMNNPQLRQMAQSMGLGGAAGGEGAGGAGAAGGNGGSPSLGDLMNNPALRNLANQFMGGQNNNNNGN